MRIEVSLSDESIYSRNDGKLLLPEIKVEADVRMKVFGLSNEYPHFLAMEQIGDNHIVTFFLHPHITAYIKAGNFDIYLTNTEIVIGCLVCHKGDPFRIKQSRKEIISTSSDNGYHAFVSIGNETTVVEALYTVKDTDKIASF